MILRFKGMHQQWIKLEQIMLGSKETLKTIVQKLSKNKQGSYVYRQSKNQYYLKIKEKIAVEIIVKKDTNSRYFQIKFVDNMKSVNVNNINDFNNILNQWCEDLIKNPQPKKMHQNYIRKEIYSINDVLKKVFIDRRKGVNDLVEFDGDMIHMASDRYKTFITSGIHCVHCGLKARYFAKERSVTSKKYHFNLYGINDENEEILFTKDHIIPKSKGGKNELSNYQTMCSKCNEKKGNNL